GRYYGDSFILIFENMNNEEQVLSFVDELRKQFRRQRFIDEESIYAKAPISASFGIALRVGSKKKIVMSIKEAEIALAEAKKKGRNRVSVYNKDEMYIIENRISDVFTLVGGLVGYYGDGEDIKKAQINQPYGVDVTKNGELLIADRGNHVIRLVNREGIISTIAGIGKYGYSGDGANAKKARLNKPSGVAVDLNGYIYIADTGNHCIRKVNAEGVIETFAGCGSEGYEGDGKHAKYSKLSRPGGVVVDMIGNVYTNDYGNNVIRM
ncbi:MAG: diguanylate cyclase, partial [Dysgonamonadaceae bacterium]|nr:diguanylate cyclase [Dysgonamonadaceae bacterium]